MALVKILILDDNRARHDAFDTIYEGHTLRHAYTYTEFLFLLHDGQPWDAIFLDHDLGDLVDEPDTYIDGWGKKREYSGAHAALRIAEMPDDKLPKRAIVIQSVNPDGAKMMMTTLKKRVEKLPQPIPVVWQPFGETNWCINGLKSDDTFEL